MKQFIKEHPWRLEIMSTLSTLFALVVPLFYYKQCASLMHPRHGLSARQTWWVEYLVGACLLIAVWYCHALLGKIIARLGVGKRDRPMAIMVVLVGTVWSVFITHWCCLWILVVWLALLIVTPIVQGRLIQGLPKDEREQNPPPEVQAALKRLVSTSNTDVRAGDRFHYIESLKLPQLPFRTEILFAAGVFLFFWWDSKYWWEAAFFAALAILFSTWNHRGAQLKLTSRAFIARTLEGQKIKLRITSIAACRVVEGASSPDAHFMMQIDYSKFTEDVTSDPKSLMEKHAYLLNVLRPLEIMTKDGEVHRFQLRDPDKVCALINAAIAARAQQEGQQ
jgi:hypothetical protein